LAAPEDLGGRWRKHHPSRERRELAAHRPCPTLRTLQAHSILVIAWHLLTRNQPYTDLGADYFLERQHSEAYRNRLVRQLERMGPKVTLEPAQVA
jgi:transposase